MASDQETGGACPKFSDTQEFLAVSGGDGDYTGVRHLDRTTDGASATSSCAEVESVSEADSSVPEGGQFPSRLYSWAD